MRRAFQHDSRCFLVSLLLVTACAGGSPERARSPDPGTARDRASPEIAVGPGRFVPDLAPLPSTIVDTRPDGSRLQIVSGMRVIDHPDGSIERAREILPNGLTRVASLPDRLGGGLVISVVLGAITQTWRAKSWLDPLVPLAELTGAVDEMAPGFDRLYVRFTSGDLKAIDLDDGGQLSLGPLPPATRIRSLAFADAWRGVAVVDFRGALTTFDAGNTWRTIPLDGQNVNLLSVREGDFTLDTSRGRYRLGAGGELTREEGPNEKQRGLVRPDVATRAQASERAPEWRGLGRRPLRAAIEDGWPVASGRETSLVFAESGTLYRVLSETGAIVETHRAAFRQDDGRCHAVELLGSFGFVCGAEGGGTAIYAFEPPLSLREVARFAHPRIVVSSGNGGLVVRGGCDREAASSPPTANGAFCFFSPSGEERSWSAPTSDAAENASLRPVALSDGRAAFLVPPSATSDGRLLLSRGAGFEAVPLRLGDRRTTLRRAELLEGVEERETGVLGAWAVLGEEFRGIRIGTDGDVQVGLASAKVERTVVSGRFAFDWGASGRGFETVDGGMKWSPVALPLALEPVHPARSAASCGPAGCAKDPWIRVGWGKGPDGPDLAPASAPKTLKAVTDVARGVSLRCYPTGETSGPPPPPPAPRVKKPIPIPVAGGPFVVHGLPRVPFGAQISGPRFLTPAPAPPTWSPFRGQPPPSLLASELGIQAGTDPPLTMQARIYAWGSHGAEWLHRGHVQARFEDRFDLAAIRSTSVTLSPWSDEDRASDALGLTAGQPVNWTALLDATGQGAVIVGQRGAGRADLYGAVSGEPLVAWRDVEGAPLPVPTSAVHIGATWFVLSSFAMQNGWATTISRVDGGIVRRLARLPRVPVPAGGESPKLMRRALGGGIGLLVQGAPGLPQVRDWYVLPVDPETGDLDEPVRLVRSDLEGQVPERCSDDRDGWLVNTELNYTLAARIVSPAATSLGSFELRLRLDAGRVCVDAIVARGEGLASLSPDAARRGANDRPFGDATLPMVAIEQSTGRKWMLRCGP